MIKINLAKLKQPPVSEEKVGGSFNPTLWKVDLEDLKEVPFKKVLVPLVIGLVLMFGTSFYQERELDGLSKSVQGAAEQGDKLKAQIKSLKSYETLKKNLDSDEVLIKTKIDVIRKLITNRTDPPRMLVSIATEIPKEVWLTDIKLTPTELTLSGGSIGFNPISDFMRALNDNPFLQTSELKSSQQNKTENGVDTANFQLTSKRR